jgi:cytochrome c-type biogenesis protein CcmH
MNMIKRKQLWSFFTLGVLVFLMATPVFAQDPSADEINEVAKNLSCPTCSGINVADCPTETCVQWRGKIGEMLAEGKSEGEILDYFATRYGDHVLQVPPKRGFFVLVWVLPVIAILAGLVWLAYLMRGWSHRRAGVTADYPKGVEVQAASDAVGDADISMEDEYLRRVQQDLEKLS